MESNGFKNSKKKPVVNADLWVQLDDLTSKHKISWYWVKGHAGHELMRELIYLPIRVG